ncbi:MAG: rhodanese-like domain-containing protein [Bacteroidetes bacterium]|nr:rhodanese-like domain-containing protein [Bacteroidota bacterium]
MNDIFYSIPKFQDFHLEGVRNIHCQEALKLVSSSKALLFDIREVEEYPDGVPKLVNGYIQYPMSSFLDYLNSLSSDKYMIIMCAHGIRSMRLAAWLTNNGWNSVINLDGGFENWKKSGLPMI